MTAGPQDALGSIFAELRSNGGHKPLVLELLREVVTLAKALNSGERSDLPSLAQMARHFCAKRITVSGGAPCFLRCSDGLTSSDAPTPAHPGSGSSGPPSPGGTAGR